VRAREAPPSKKSLYGSGQSSTRRHQKAKREKRHKGKNKSKPKTKKVKERGNKKRSWAAVTLCFETFTLLFYKGFVFLRETAFI
jgi:hypothetical protein